MIGRRATVGLSLLCALLFSAFAAQSVSAAKGVNTTAVTCIEGGTQDFSDSHCDVKVAAGTGKFGHETIPTGTTTELSVKGTEPAVLKAKALGSAIEITCTTVSGQGVIHNEQTEGKHTVTGEVSNTITNCSVQKPAKCVVTEPIVINAEFEGVEELGPEKNSMGVEFRPPGGKQPFVTLSFKNKGAEACALNGKTASVEGSVIATGTPAPTEKHAGSTSVLTFAGTKETLKCGGNAAEFSGKAAISMKEGNPIAFTTTT